MKVLCIVEINEEGNVISPKPEKVFKENADEEQITNFFENATTLYEKFSTMKTIEQNKMIRLDANFNEIFKMGFVHRSELDKYFEKKLTETQSRITIKFYMKYYITDPLKKGFMKMVTGVGSDFLKNLIKKSSNR